MAPVGLSAAVLLVVAGLVFFVLSFNNSSGYVSVDLALNNSNRAESTAPVRVQLADLKVNLTLPEQAKEAKDFRGKLVDENGVERDLTISEQTDQTITVTILAAWLSRGSSYVIQLSIVKPDGSEERIRGSYNFVVE